MREWLTPRCLLIAMLLIVAPGAALAHLLLNWAPIQMELNRLDRTLARDASNLTSEVEKGLELQGRNEKLSEAAQAALLRSRWLAVRDRDGVFDRLADAFRCDGVSIEQLTFDSPGFYAAASADNLLACERVTVLCTGDYGGLTACLDRLQALDLSIVVRDLNWSRGNERLTLALKLDVPFVPDDALRKILAAEAGLNEESHEP